MKLLNLLFYLTLAISAYGEKTYKNILQNPSFLTEGGKFPSGWQRAYNWNEGDFNIEKKKLFQKEENCLKIKSTDGTRTIRSSKMEYIPDNEINFNLWVKSEEPGTTVVLHIIGEKFKWRKLHKFTVGENWQLCRLQVFPESYKDAISNIFFVRVDLKSNGTIYLASPFVSLPAINCISEFLEEDMSAIWGGNEKYSWYNRRQGYDSKWSYSLSNLYGWGLWDDELLIKGHINLSIPYKSISNTYYLPWSLGKITDTFLKNPGKKISFSEHGFLGACSLGESLHNTRFIYNTLYNEKNGDEFTRVTSLFHPAREYRANSKELSMFSGMPECGQPTGPMWAFLPLRGKFQIRKITGKATLYDKENDGPLDSGWLLVFFSSADDGRKNDLPMLVNFSHNPDKIETPNANPRTGATKGLKFKYPKKQLRSYSLMPLYGAKSISKEETLSWLKAEKLPEETIKRLKFWHLASLKLPVQMKELFKINQKAKKIDFLSKFSYTENLSEWEDVPILLSPISPFLALSSRFMPYGNPKLKNLDMPLEKGPYCAAVGTDVLVYSLKIPDISMDFPGVNLEKLKKDQVCDKYLKELNSEHFFKLMDNTINRQLSKKTPMPHVAVTWEWTRVYPFLSEKNKQRFRKVYDKAFEKVVFNPSLKDKMYPRLYAYKKNGLSYLNLTKPYGCPEPFWNLGRVLAALGDYCYTKVGLNIYY